MAFLVREPLALQKLHEVTCPDGHLLVCEVHGASLPLTVVCAYRRPERQDSMLFLLDNALAPFHARHWVLCADWNCPPDSQFGMQVRRWGGSLAATAGHVSSPVPIDSIWTDSALSVSDVGSLPVLSDHGGALVRLRSCRPTHCPAWTLRKCRVLLPGPELPPDLADTSWLQVAVSREDWQHVLSNDTVDVAWQTWCSDAERFLASCGLISSCVPGRASRGVSPSVLTGQCRVGQGQPFAERCLRRAVRRFDEALLHSRRGRVIPEGLRYSLHITCRHFGWSHLASADAWGQCRLEAHRLLSDELGKGFDKAISAWRALVSTYEGAVKWVKRDAPKGFLLEDMQGQVVAGRAASARALAEAWQPLFCGEEGYEPQPHLLLDAYREFYPSRPSFALPPLDPAVLQQTTRAMRRKAAGTDLWTAEALLSLPACAWARLCDILHLVKATGQWPSSSLRNWRVTFLPKGSKDRASHVHDVRPIAVGLLVYRVWSKVRFRQVADFWRDLLHPLQLGGRSGMDAEALVVALLNEASHSSHLFGVSMDFRKAFDSVHWSTALMLMRRAGLPEAIAATSVAGSVSGVSASNSAGDPFSPVALAIVLSGPVFKVTRTIASALTTLYLDDRTGVFRTLPHMQAYTREWSCFESLGRLKTHPLKTQCWAGTVAAERQLRRAGFSPSRCIEVLGCLLGSVPRGLTAKEIKRQDACARLAYKIGVLPVRCHLKHRFSATLLAAKAAWGPAICGRAPTNEEGSIHYRNCVLAVRGPRFVKGRASLNLRKVFWVGHASEKFLAGCRLLSAVSRWFRHRHTEFPQAWSDHSKAVLADCLGPSDWQPSDSGARPANPDPRGPVFRFGDDKPAQQRAFHELRESWRIAQLRQWLASDRRDAVFARGMHWRVSRPSLQRARAAAQQVDGFALAVMTGNMATAAIDFNSGSRRHPVQRCPDCGRPCVPSVHHVLWQCTAYADLRVFRQAPPRHAVVRRLGWGDPRQSLRDTVSLLQQLGAIHERELSWRGRRQGWLDGRSEGPLVGR